MPEVIYALIILVVVAIAGFMLLRKNRTNEKEAALRLMQQQIDGLRQQVGESLFANSQLLNQQLGELNTSVNRNLQNLTDQMFSSQKTVGDRLDAAARMVGEVRNNLGTLTQATQRVFDVGKDIAELQEILRAPKLRGVIGELFLGDLLGQMLPASNFNLQHRFKSGEVVDAVVRLGNNMVSVDSKFPLENFRRISEGTGDDERGQARKKFLNDVKKHVDCIAAKYIVPDENTFDFALMYIPAENVYYEMIIKDSFSGQSSLCAYALERRVVPVSPNSFYAYLQAIVLGLKGMKVEKHVQEIIDNLSRLSSDMDKFKGDFTVLGKHIVNLKNKYDETEKKVSRFEEKLLGICQVDKDKELLIDDQS